MAPKKVTNVKKHKKKIIITTVELKKNLSLSGKRVHVYRTWLFNMVGLSRQYRPY
jgi:DNA-binding CsgD family transcriptional regulator